jgi:hypothetical protein
MNNTVETVIISLFYHTAKGYLGLWDLGFMSTNHLSSGLDNLMMETSDLHSCTGANHITRINKTNNRSVDVIYPTVIIDDVSVKLLKSVNNFLFSGFRVIGRALVGRVRRTCLRPPREIYRWL